jgi:hypothetical protein
MTAVEKSLNNNPIVPNTFTFAFFHMSAARLKFRDFSGLLKFVNVSGPLGVGIWALEW